MKDKMENQLDTQGYYFPFGPVRLVTRKTMGKASCPHPFPGNPSLSWLYVATAQGGASDLRPFTLLPPARNLSLMPVGVLSVRELPAGCIQPEMWRDLDKIVLSCVRRLARMSKVNLNTGDLVKFTAGEWGGLVGIITQPITTDRSGHVLVYKDGHILGVEASIDDHSLPQLLHM